MSKSLLIVICDFLLLSLLSIANFDKPKQTNAQKKESEIALKSETFVQTQMLETLKTALEAEQRRHVDLSRDVEKLSQTAQEQRAQAQTHQKTIQERERQLAQIRQAKADLEKERMEILQKSKQLEAKVDSADKRNESLQKEIVAAVSKLEKSADERIRLEQELGHIRESDATARNKLRQAQEELRQNKENLSRLQRESEQLKLENRAIEAEKLALATKLEVASTKTQIYAENLKKAQAMINIEKAEKEKIIEHAESLSTNVSKLATNQQTLSKSIDRLRPLTASEAFANISGLFVEINFKYSEGGLLGKNNTRQKLYALPFLRGSKVELFFDIDSTPLDFSRNERPPEKLEATVSAYGKIWNVNRINRVSGSNKILSIELPDGFVPQSKAVRTVSAKDRYKYTDCIVINPSTKYYGQTPFMANFTRREYAKLDVGLIESVFKKFSPSANDVALTRTGQALGVMTSSSDLFLTENAQIGPYLEIGQNYSPASAVQFVK